jgi:hypothetical protein
MAEILLEFWPLSKRGDAWHGAMEACLRALEAQSNPEAAKAAFVMAARDAEMHIDNNAENYAPPPQRLPREKRPGRRRQR